MSSFGELIKKTVLYFYDSYKTASDSTKLAIDYNKGLCLYITDNEAMILRGEYKDDMRYFRPKGITRLFRVKKRYLLKPDKEPFVICYEGNVDTISLDMIPKVVEYEKRDRSIQNIFPQNLMEEADKDEASRKIKSIDFKKYRIKGADILSSFAEEVNDNVHLRFIKSYPNWTILLIGIVCGLFGIIIGGIIATLISVMVGLLLFGAVL